MNSSCSLLTVTEIGGSPAWAAPALHFLLASWRKRLL